MYKIIFHNQNHKDFIYNIIKETKNFAYLYQNGRIMNLKLSKKTNKVWFYSKDFCTKTYKGFRTDSLKANIVEKIN